MSDQDIKQRIEYLVQHGGIWDDPLADLRRGLRWAIGIGSMALTMNVIDLLF